SDRRMKLLGSEQNQPAMVIDEDKSKGQKERRRNSSGPNQRSKRAKIDRALRDDPSNQKPRDREFSYGCKSLFCLNAHGESQYVVRCLPSIGLYGSKKSKVMR